LTRPLGGDPDDIIDEYPDLNKEQITACLDYARDLAQFEVEVA
jgi:uncharacterized protein (DUF433 family)